VTEEEKAVVERIRERDRGVVQMFGEGMEKADRAERDRHALLVIIDALESRAREAR
jgi:hypothetical protein